MRLKSSICSVLLINQDCTIFWRQIPVAITTAYHAHLLRKGCSLLLGTCYSKCKTSSGVLTVNIKHDPIIICILSAFMD